MGYFNYFIKCIIKNITYKLFKPKVFLTVLLSVLVLFVLHSTGYCAEWSESDIDFVTDRLSAIENALHTIVAYDTSTYNKLVQTYDYLVKALEEQSLDQQTYLLELQKLTTAIYGTVTKTDVAYSRTKKNLIFSNNSYYFTSGSTGFATFSYDSNHSYEISVTNNGDTAYTLQVAGTVQNITSTSSSVQAVYLGSVDIPVGATYKWLVSSGYEDVDYIVFRCEDIFSVNLYRYDRKTDGILGNLDNIGETMDKNNELQEESNQLQQEQNDFLKQETTDSDVSVDSFNSVDSNDITTEGLTGVFTNIYNSITSWSSKDINLPIPYTNKNIVIPANYTENMLSSFGGGWIITFISSIYYFIVARFIIYSITSIINSIKSGSILETDSKNNITTDML